MSNYPNLKEKVALITGGSSGIGAATARMLAANGARIAINFHQNRTGAEKVRDEIVSAGGKAICVQADVANSSEVDALIKRAVEELGPMDILVNNAGSLIERLR